MCYMEMVENLNQIIYEEHGEVEDQFFFLTNGDVVIIGFGDIDLWCSEDDDREYLESQDSYEPMVPFILEKLKNYGEFLVTINSKITNKSLKIKNKN